MGEAVLTICIELPLSSSLFFQVPGHTKYPSIVRFGQNLVCDVVTYYANQVQQSFAEKSKKLMTTPEEVGCLEKVCLFFFFSNLTAMNLLFAGVTLVLLSSSSQRTAPGIQCLVWFRRVI